MLPKLEVERRDLFIISLFFFMIFSLNLYLSYQNYKKLKTTPYAYIEAKVLSIYNKKSKNLKSYRLLRLKNHKMNFFGVDWRQNRELLAGDKIGCKIKTKNITFYKYLKGFFTPVYNVKVLNRGEDSLKKRWVFYIQSQHNSFLTKELFAALFLGEKISSKTRKSIQLLGISHLIAISGFHLGVLTFLLYTVFSLVYKFFQDRFFPYRNLKLDFMLFSIFVIFGYIYIVGFLPSLLRAFVMMLVGYLLYIRYIKILSFETLFLTILLLLAFFPTLLFNISFWFSVSGVFFIFLFLKYFKHLKKWQIFIAMNFWVYIMMMPIVHTIFASFSLYQLFSPFLSILFVLFYPLELVLHLIKEGDLLDSAILKLLSFEAKSIYLHTPFWFIVVYVASSLLAVYKRYFLYLTMTLSGLFFIYMLTKFLTLNF